DRYQLEFKLAYPIDRAQKRTHYRLSIFIFVPQNLGIHRHSYTSADFYRDIQNYIRLKTPSMSLTELAEEPASPLNVMTRLLREGNWPKDRETAGQLINSFKFTRAILKSAIRDELEAFVRQMAGRADDAHLSSALAEQINDLCAQVQTVVRAYRTAETLLPETIESANPLIQEVRLAYKLSDEAISLLVERDYVRALLLLRRLPQDERVRQVAACLAACAEAEAAYRRAQGYTSVIDPNSRNEEYMYRASVLKKYTSSVLFLYRALRREGTVLEQVLYAVAAGVSMIFATLVAFYFQQRYGNFTTPFFAALVVGYMFKDRIKEIGRLISSRYLQRYLYDRRIDVRTMDGQERLGYIREKMHFIPEGEVPPEVMQARNRQLMTELANDGQGEQVIRYDKEVTLFCNAFEHIYPNMPQFTGLNDIMRYDIRPFLYKMANPTERVLYVQNGRLRKAKAHRLYAVNFVLVYQDKDRVQGDGQAVIYERSRAMMDRKGLQKVEVFA
ncbi:MAG: hypothetical protein D6790_09890, partial [Caldilineae bacterium]